MSLTLAGGNPEIRLDHPSPAEGVNQHITQQLQACTERLPLLVPRQGREGNVEAFFPPHSCRVGAQLAGTLSGLGHSDT